MGGRTTGEGLALFRPHVAVYDAHTLPGVGGVPVTDPGWPPLVANLTLSPDSKRAYARVAPDW